MQIDLLIKIHMQSREEIKQQMFTKIEQWQQSGLSQKPGVNRRGSLIIFFITKLPPVHPL